MAALQARFLAGAASNGVEASVAEAAFDQLRGFATYGFCKSHAASFALIAYQTLWLKAHYPAEFFCAILNHQPMGFYSPEVVAGDAKRHGITLLRPDVNASEDACTLPGDVDGRPCLRLGLRYLSGLGEAGRARLLSARGDLPFPDLAGFCRRTRLPRQLVGELIRAGAADGFGAPRRQLLWELGGLQYQEETLLEAPELPVDLPDLTEGEAFAWDYELLGLAPDDHPLRLWRARLRSQGVLTAAELMTRPTGGDVRVAGMVVVRQAPPTAKGHLFITLEDETGLVNLIIRPDLRERARPELHNATLLVAEGRLQREGAAASMVVRTVSGLGDEIGKAAERSSWGGRSLP
jgi:error-prone DNA polymerase